ncbi:plasmid partitioning protein ParB [Planococcus glaciei]|uniref:ParB/RepB/Spo0J family partition protein n=2 Tax=Planococcus TaxID=1372 RepID=A0A1G8MEK3_9BACL|nr:MULTISPECIES: ParB/RepB/Spo0J family partition protein [Planococcus]ETP66983.1 plasmid partitioning protein ParB [Planococcus glaciei CHR43]KOF09720.1 plasmid partitioning protein ParB [Planococcus glaciei]MBX0316208.1 ParB/RepB/Spo0J family partition protein [Planococcus glaciei]MDN7228550.1 ParB/RepB/Spo0J family partition protein [Planococcus sp. N064]QKX50339.1 ParB/RepB/Spo0J family partition protein [Planococcus glaciei]
MAKGLGKGINALFPGESLSETETINQISITQIRTNPYQPRKVFDETALQELSESIKEHGILQPVVVRKSGKHFELVVGERRFRAAKLAKLTEVPALVKELTDQQMMELAILENLQREDLTPIEEAEAYQKLMEALNITQEQLAFRLGKSRPHIANHIRLLALPANVRDMISDKKLTMGHGRTLLGLRLKKLIPETAEKVVKENLNVRQLENLVQRLNEDVPRETIEKKKDLFIEEKQSELRDRFGTNVQIKKTKNKGKIEIEFFSEEDLERILELLN